MVSKNNSKFLVIGGSGFIGSHFVMNLLESGFEVTVIDDLSSGKIEFLNFLNNENLKVIIDDISNWRSHSDKLQRIDVIIHLASNADIAAAMADPTIDFYKGTLLTQHVAELARELGIKRILYASGSGVYGDYGNSSLKEGGHELLPISPYGASKLAGEAILCSYSYLFEIKVSCFRFANVVGANQTHGVGLDFVKSLKRDSSKLKILGDGNQSKSYIFVEDIIDAVLFVLHKQMDEFATFNVSTYDRLSVNEIADLAIDLTGPSDSKVKRIYTGGSRGWAGDVPVVNLNTEKIKNLGWEPKYNSRQSMLMALSSIWEQN